MKTESSRRRMVNVQVAHEVAAGEHVSSVHQGESEPDDILLFFFFQAEDGIRDLTVTGVQTCALPIWIRTINSQERGLSIVLAYLREYDREASFLAVDRPDPALPLLHHLHLSAHRQIGRASCRERV